MKSALERYQNVRSVPTLHMVHRGILSDYEVITSPVIDDVDVPKRSAVKRALDGS